MGLLPIFTHRVHADANAHTIPQDTAGQERFHSLGPIYYRDSHGALLVYDITDRSSFDRVQLWVKELRKMLGPEIVLVIVGLPPPPHSPLRHCTHPFNAFTAPPASCHTQPTGGT
eukprot:TRINITY_DN298_c0_g1_i4.p1 TRINITY_DN298_c0_g1~~TRINITY_DN298_c0_g1_i4.p1  ORF type:complete len:115 (-),score=20.62 TRINITY_DN298_c0_g1_i4:430-774(-)